MHRTARLTLAVALSGALVATGVAPARAGTPVPGPAVVSADTSPPRISQVRFSRASVAVRGLALVPVRVSMRVTDASGVAQRPHLTLSPVAGFQSRLRPVLSRTAGTAADGTWSATVNMPSTWNGTVRIVSAGAVDPVGNEVSRPLTGAASPKLRVRGTHRPALSFTYSLLAGGGFRIHGKAFYTDTGRPIRHRALATAYDSNCDLEGGAVNDIVTDARGRYSKRWPAGGEAAAGCVALTGRAARHQPLTVLVYRLGSAPTYAVPAAAMLQPADLGGAATTTVTDDYWAALRPPQPCGPYPSAGQRRAERAVQAMIGVDGRPSVVVNDVAVYHSDGARQYLRQVRRAVAGCAGWTIAGTGVAGDESLLLRRREHLDYADTDKDTYVVVARTGRALVTVADTGWETGDGHEAVVRRLAGVAVTRAAAVVGR